MLPDGVTRCSGYGVVVRPAEGACAVDGTQPDLSVLCGPACTNGSPDRDSHLAGMTAPRAPDRVRCTPTTYTVSPMTARPVP